MVLKSLAGARAHGAACQTLAAKAQADDAKQEGERRSEGGQPGNRNAARAIKAMETDAADRAQRRPSTPRAGVGDGRSERPRGNSRAAALRALSSHPEIKSRVLSGEITPNKGMVEAGTGRTSIRGYSECSALAAFSARLRSFVSFAWAFTQLSSHGISS